MVKRETVFSPGLRALRTAWLPMLLIQSVLFVVVLGYFFVDEVRGVLEHLGDIKDRGGILSAVIVGFTAGGILPELAKWVTGRLKRGPKWLGDTFYTGCVYVVIAVSVWALFAFQEATFGPTRDIGVLLAKVFIDMLVFSPFFSIPLALHLFGWRDSGFQKGYLRNIFDWGFYKRNVGPALVMCWAYWGPIVFGLYLFPERLQFVISAFCQAAWSLLFVLMVRGERG